MKNRFIVLSCCYCLIIKITLFVKIYPFHQSVYATLVLIVILTVVFTNLSFLFVKNVYTFLSSIFSCSDQIQISSVSMCL